MNVYSKNHKGRWMLVSTGIEPHHSLKNLMSNCPHVEVRPLRNKRFGLGWTCPGFEPGELVFRTFDMPNIAVQEVMAARWKTEQKNRNRRRKASQQKKES